MEIYNIVQVVVIKTISKKKKCKKAKWLPEEALQIVEKRREAKGKGEKERYNSYQYQTLVRQKHRVLLYDYHHKQSFFLAV